MNKTLFRKKLSLITILLFNVNIYAQNYDWQQHVPVEAKKWIPAKSNNCLFEEDMRNSTRDGENNTYNSSTHYGNLIMNPNTIIKGPIMIYGNLEAKNSSFNSSITLFGNAKLNGNNNCIVGPAKIKGSLDTNGMIFESQIEMYGFLSAANSIFTKPIIIHTAKLNFDRSIIHELIINDKDDRPAQVTFNNCKLEGNIHVESGKGTIKINNSDVSPNVTITGAQVIRN